MSDWQEQRYVRFIRGLEKDYSSIDDAVAALQIVIDARLDLKDDPVLNIALVFAKSRLDSVLKRMEDDEPDLVTPPCLRNRRK